MPNGKRKPRTRKRVYKKKRKAPLPLGMPSTKLVRMPYVSFATIDPTTLAAGYRTYRANSIYDPDYTAVSGASNHQPYTHDTWQTIYNKYSVISSKITVKFTPSATANSMPVIVGICLDDDASFPITGAANVNLLLERNNTTYRQMSVSGADKTVTLSKVFNAKRWFGRKAQDDDILSASFGANPAKMAFFGVFAAPTDNAASDDPPYFNITTRIEYICMLSEPIDLAQS